MDRARYILRGLFFLVTVLLLVHLNRKTGVNLKTVAKFKFETLNKIRTDSLSNEDKLDVLVKETEKFSRQITDDSSRFLEGVYYLIAVVVLSIVSEIIFFVIKKRWLPRQT